MILQITSINMRYDNKNEIETVQVSFNANDEGRTKNVNGYVSLTVAEYEGNEAIPDLTALVKSKVKNSLNA